MGKGRRKGEGGLLSTLQHMRQIQPGSPLRTTITVRFLLWYEFVGVELMG
jgi:hypothetical protein